jgi:hypothetical protein
VALSEKLRSSIFRSLSTVIGEEETAAVLSHFPARDVEEPVTKEHLQLELALVRSDLANFRAEMHQLLNRALVTLITAMVAIAGLALTIASQQG